MAKKKLFKSKTNFTLRRLHQSGSYGNIYERDYTTIVNSLENPGGQIPIYNSPSFKLTVRAGLNKQKKYSMGRWANNPLQCSDSKNDNNIWTLSCMPELNINSAQIVLKPHTRRLTDFACYGSSSELVKASINNIVKNFPAEIYVGEQTLADTGILEDTNLNDTDISKYGGYYIVDNPLYIDLMQHDIPENSQVNPLRYFSQSFEDYDLILSNPKYKTKTMWEITPQEQNETCLTNGSLLSKVKVGVIDEDGFKKEENGDVKDKDDIVIDKDIAVIVNDGVVISCFYYEGKIIYASNSKNYRIRPKQEKVNKFFQNLTGLEKVLLNPHTNYTAIFETYHETEEDGWCVTEKVYRWPLDVNKWNISIRGVEYARYINALTELAEGYDILFTDAIWRTMTHESITNMDLTNSGDKDMYVNGKTKMHQTINVIGRQFDEIKKYIDTIKSSNTITYCQDKNTPDYFLSDNLELSGWESKNILTYIDPTIKTEPIYSSRTEGFTSIDANFEFMRRLKLNSKYILREKGTKKCIEDLLAIFGFHSCDWLNKYYKEGIDNENAFSLKKAFILKEYVYITRGYNRSPDTYKDIIEDTKRLNQLKDSYDISDINDIDATIDLYKGLPVAEAVIGEKVRLIPWINKNNKYDAEMYFQMKGGWSKDEKGVYDYTISKIHYVRNTDELCSLSFALLETDSIYFVNNENKFYRIKDINKHNTLNDWEEITKENELTQYQNIIDNNKGNNPHTGEYDGGDSFLKGFRQLFYKSTFENTKDELVEKASKCGFLIDCFNDTTKCSFYNTKSNTDGTKGDLRTGDFIENFNPASHFDLFEMIAAYNEESSLSVINSKVFDIVFDETYEEYVINDIIPYLKQVIPSTTIFSYSFETLQKYKREA